MRRRDVLLGLASAALVGCPRAPGAVAPGPTRAERAAPAKVRLGWRWIPGTAYTFDSIITRNTGDVLITRGESWTYTARELDSNGVVLLQGMLGGFGAVIEVNGDPLPEPRMRPAREAARDATPTEVELRMRLTGRLISCSIEDFAGSLPHRLLAMHMPSDPVPPGTSWEDPALALAFAQLIPVELPVRITASTTLSRFGEVEKGWEARLDHQAAISTTDDGPAVLISGYSTWDADLGALTSRRLDVHLEPEDVTSKARLGSLRIELHRKIRNNPPVVPGA